MHTLEELKIAAYDLLVHIASAQRQLQAVETEIQKRQANTSLDVAGSQSKLAGEA